MVISSGNVWMVLQREREYVHSRGIDRICALNPGNLKRWRGRQIFRLRHVDKRKDTEGMKFDWNYSFHEEFNGVSNGG